MQEAGEANEDPGAALTSVTWQTAQGRALIYLISQVVSGGKDTVTPLRCLAGGAGVTSPSPEHIMVLTRFRPTLLSRTVPLAPLAANFSRFL